MGQSKSFLSVPSLGKETVEKAEGKEKQNCVVKFDLMVHSFHSTVHLEPVPSSAPAGNPFFTASAPLSSPSLPPGIQRSLPSPAPWF